MRLRQYLLFGNYIVENCITLTEIGPKGSEASLAPPLDPPM